MLYAININGELVRPISHKQKATDPYSGKEVIGVTGVGEDLNYWKHSDGSYDAWSLPVISWTLRWKLQFPKELVEVSLQGNEERHVADVRARNETVIKFQCRMLQSEQIQQRERFFGKMVWVFRADKWDLSIEQMASNSYTNTEGKCRQLPVSDQYEWWKFESKHPKYAFKTCKMPVFLDVGDDYLYWINWQLFTNISNDFDPSNGAVKRYSKKDFINKYQ